MSSYRAPILCCKALASVDILSNDLDKLVRSTLDGLTGVAYKDDCQIIRILASKRYADFEDEGAEIFIHALDI